jgi:hypothetical protein
MSLSLLLPWTCRTCIRSRAPQTPRNFFYSTVRNAPKPKSRRRVAIATFAGLGIVGTAVAVSDEGKHFVRATQRSARVVKTLALCINE